MAEETVHEFCDFPEEKPVVISTKGQDGKVVKKKYFVRDFGGEGLKTWMGVLAARARAERDRQAPAFDNFQATLIGMCLFDEHGAQVPVDTISKWPSATQQGLFELCRQINGLDDNGLERAKKVLVQPRGHGTA